MSGEETTRTEGDDDRASRVRRLLGRVLRGEEDPRLRATFRALVAVPVVTVLLTPLSGQFAGVVVPPGTPKVGAMAVVGVFQAALVAGLLVVWARYVDRRPVGEYGLSATPEWALDLAVGFGAVLVGHAVWYGLGVSVGWTEVTLAPSAGGGALAVGLVALLVAFGLNVWVQETVFVAVPLRNAAEGLATRGVTHRRAVLAGWVFATLLFAWVHGRTGLATWINLLVALGTYALLYAHTGELALPVGVHLGVNYLGGAVFTSGDATVSVFRVTESIGGLAGSVSGGRLPQVLVAYLLLLAWLRWRHGEVAIRTDVAEWTGR
jgi:hypothetical protein